MTNRGFYSVVEKEWDRADGTLTVRARTLEDIERFVEMCPTSPIDTVLVESRPDYHAEESTQSAFIEEDERADYRWRIRIDREAADIGDLPRRDTRAETRQPFSKAIEDKDSMYGRRK